MEQIIVRSILAINEHQRLLSTITQIQTMENHMMIFVRLLHLYIIIKHLGNNIIYTKGHQNDKEEEM
jgi:hypothetical protein